MKQSLTSRSRHGFSMAELLVALLLFALAAFVLGRAAMDSLNTMLRPPIYQHNHRILHESRAAIFAARSRAELEAGGEREVALMTRTEDGADTETVRLRWEAEVTPTRILNLFAVDLTVRIEGGEERQALIEERFYAYRPSWVDAEEQEQLLNTKEDLFRELREARGEQEEDEP
jgi:prepilin-type N-terminal cleavage/methylation domain-containing protein